MALVDLFLPDSQGLDTFNALRRAAPNLPVLVLSSEDGEDLAKEAMTGWTRRAATGQPLDDVFHIIDGETRERAQNPMGLAVQLDKTVGLTANCVLMRRDGREVQIEDSAAPIHDRDGRVTGAVILFHDVGTALERARQMSHLAQHDMLTG